MDNQEIFGTMYSLFVLIVAIFFVACGWQIFTKAGKPGWAVLIPIYNIVVMLEIIGKPIWWLLLFFIPFVNLIISIWTTNLLVKSFGKSEGFTIGMVLLPFVFYPVLAFGSSQYQGPAGSSVVVSPTY